MSTTTAKPPKRMGLASGSALIPVMRIQEWHDRAVMTPGRIRRAPCERRNRVNVAVGHIIRARSGRSDQPASRPARLSPPSSLSDSGVGLRARRQ
jgi:hypothetical protein